MTRVYGAMKAEGDEALEVSMSQILRVFTCYVRISYYTIPQSIPD